MKPQTTNHKPQTTNHKPQTTNHKPQTTLVLTILILLSFSQLQSQNSSVPYDPCPPAFYELDTRYCSSQDLRKCTYYGEGQFPCSPGYCFEGPTTFNGGIPSGGTVSGVNIEITGTYYITQNVVFTNCFFKMHGGAKIIVNPGSTSTIKVEFDGCTFFGCNQMWYGISTENTQNSNLLFNFKRCWVEDAYTGLELEEGAYNNYYIVGSTFTNNFIGIGNRLKNDAPLNAVIGENLFTVAASLASSSGSGLPSMPGYPAPKAGISFEHTTAKVGGLLSKNATHSNTFTCLYQGIYAENCILSSENNNFTELRSDGYGIKAIKGNIHALSNAFTSAGRNAIDCDGTSLYAEKNSFSGNTEKGIYSYNNLNGQTVIVRDTNYFEMNTNRWIYGIQIERSAAATGSHNQVINNIFAITNGSSIPEGIYVSDLLTASLDIARIDSNWINIGGASPKSTVGIHVQIGNSNNVWIRRNNIQFNTTWPSNNLPSSFGIFVQKGFGAQLSSGHKVRNNHIAGVDLTSYSCGIHVVSIQGTEFCDNFVDYSNYGLHFRSSNDVLIRENKMHNHNYGFRLDGSPTFVDGTVGLQPGKGNTWSTNASDCVISAAACLNCNDPLSSKFSIKEANLLPFLPPAVKLNPNPTVIKWFEYLPNTTLDYCEPDPEGPTTGVLDLVPFERSVIYGTSSATGAALWDLNFQIYKKLLAIPSLRPTGSAEETFFNSFSSTYIATLANINQTLEAGLSISSSNDNLLSSDFWVVQNAWNDLTTLDDNTNFASPPTVSSGYYSTRLVFLQTANTSGIAASLIEQAHQVQVSIALSNALSSISASTPGTTQETANKLLFDFSIRKVARLPITQSQYLQVLNLAGQSETQVGNAAYLAVGLLGVCEQVAFRAAEEPANERDNNIEDNSRKYLENSSLKLYPNPSSGLVEVNIPGNQGGILRIINPLGTIIHTILIAPNQCTATIDLSSAISGAYQILFISFSPKDQPISASLLKM